MKILMLTTQLGYGGAETSFIRLANFLQQLHTVTVALFTADYGNGTYAAGNEPLNAPITVLDDAVPSSRPRRWWRRLRRLRTLKQQHDVTISFLSGPNLLNVASGYNRRSIISLRGSRHYDPVAPRFQQLLFQYMFDPIIFHLAARIVPVSAGLTHEIRAAAGTAMLSKVRVISPFIDAATIAARLGESTLEPYSMLLGQNVIVAVGRLSIEKGFHHLIRVVGGLANIQPGVKLLLIGDGPMLSTLRSLCAEIGIVTDDFTLGVSAVIFAGYQKNALPLMALGRVYAMTSATEGFPNVLLEAIAAGLPIVAADPPWGVRAILSDEPASRPYPTDLPTSTPYGMLMPRIDQSENANAWVQALHHHLLDEKVIYPNAADRLQQCDLAIVGEQWNQLLQEMETV